MTANVPILLVDDRPDGLLALEAVLDGRGYELVTASSGLEAVRQLEQRDFAVVLLDVRMPAFDGFETAARMKTIAREGRRVPIIFVTGGDASPTSMLMGYEQGAVDFIQKPLIPEVLRAKVALFAELHRARESVHVEQKETARRLQSLTELSIALSRARTRDQVAAAFVDEGIRAAGADTCALYALDDARSTLVLIRERGWPVEGIEGIRRIPETDASRDVFTNLKTGTATWAETADQCARVFPTFAAIGAPGRRSQAFWSIPLMVEGNPVGLLGMGFREPRPFPPAERLFIDAFAQQSAQALQRAVLLERDEREGVRREFLARAGAALASSLDYRTTLTTVAQFAVPQLADWCVVDLLEPGDAAPQQVAVAHVDPKKVQWARALGEKYPPDPQAPSGVPQVIRTGKSELYAELPASLIEGGAKDAEHLRVLRELQLTSAMIVPLPGRERTLGAMSFVYAASGRRYTQDDVAFAEEFARRAAMAIENARAMKEADEARAAEHALRIEADAASRAKDEFLAIVSHELRTPLTAILGWTVILRGRNSSPDADRALDVIERNARRQTRLIEDLLDMSRIIGGKLALNVKRVGVADVVSAAIETVRPAADAKALTLGVDVDPSLTMNADGDRMQQVVWNLLSNAVKFTPQGGSVEIEAHREGDDLVLSVKDSGEGIPPDSLAHVFDAFRQADASITRKHGGLGLGLAIVKQLVAAHGGTVRATSDGVGHGATIVVRVPCRSLTPLPRALAASLPSEDVPDAAGRLARLSVLVVDDDRDSRELVAEILRGQGATVSAVSSASEALQAMTAGPDVLVSDIGMPGMDGYTLMRQVRLLPADRGARTPALALTAYARGEDAQQAFDAGFQMHLAKPVDPARLADIVATLGSRAAK